MMINEIYIRTENDPYFVPGIIDYSNDVENVISQIRMILGTKNGQVLGDYDFGVDLEYAVFKTKRSASELEEGIMKQIGTYVKKPSGITVSCSVNFGKDERGDDYSVIDIYINGVKSVGFLVDKSN